MRLLINKPLVRRHQNWILQDSIFFVSELPTLARYPPQQGLRVINEHSTVRCRHLMLFIRDRIEEFGLVEDWQNVDTFSCVDAAKVKKSKENLSYIDQTAVEFMRPGKKAPSECDISQVISDEDYSKCADEGHLDFGFMRRVAQQMPPRTLTCSSTLRISEIEPFKSGENFHLLEDLAKMFNTSIVEELFLAATCKDTAKTPFGQKAKAILVELTQLAAFMSNVNVKDKDGRTPLIWAVEEGHTEVAKELIGAKADVNVKDERSRAPLMLAVEKGHAEVAKELIDAKADVHFKGMCDDTPLILAVKEGHAEVAKELIDAKADVNVKDNKHGRTPLIWAVLKGRTEVAKELIGAKADVNVKDNRGKTPLIWAAENENGRTELAKELITAKADVNVKDKFGKAPLIWAVLNGHTEVAKELIGAKADVNVKDKFGQTPLIWAAKKGAKKGTKKGHTEVVKELIDAKADDNVKDNKHERTPLIWAVLKGHTEVAKELIGAKADVNVKDKFGKTPLIWAAENGHMEIANMLKDVEAPKKFGA